MDDASYEIKLTNAAAKDLVRFRQWKSDVDRAFGELSIDPYRGDQLKGSLAGARSMHFRIRGSGEARIAYVIREELNRCVLFAIGHRENFYDLAARRYEALGE